MEAIRKKEKWIENFARTGIIAKGIVYCLVGLLTAMAAWGYSGKKMSKEDTFKLIYDQPFGKVLLILIAIGLFGYVTWRLFQAIRDIDHKGKRSKAIFIRIGYGISALAYLALGIYALKLAFAGPSSGGNGESKQFFVSKLLDYPGGNWILGIAAIIIIISGINQVYKGFSKKFMKNVTLVQNKYVHYFTKVGIVGYISRGVVWLTIGYFIIRAALDHNANEIQGTKGAFDFLENNFGSVLMGLVAIGLLGYGIFMFFKGRYQKIDFNF